MAIRSAPLTDLVRILGRRFDEDRCVQIASTLTLTTLLALVPMITVALTIASAFPVFESMIGAVQRFLVNNIVPESVSSITGYAAQFSENATQLTAMGIAFIAVTALMMMITIDNAFNAIWRTQRKRSLLQRILVYWIVLTIGPVFFGASLSVTSYLIRFSLGFIEHPPGLGVLILRIASLLLTATGLALLTRPWGVALLPALVLLEEIQRVLKSIMQVGLNVRGLYGEHSEIMGNLFQISNQTTLGRSERDSIESLERVTRQIIETEERARERMLRDARTQLEDKVWRAYGTLRYCRSIQAKEVINLCSAVRLGVAMGLEGLCPLRVVNELLVSTQPAHLQRLAGEEMAPPERNLYRAQVVRERLVAAERETGENRSS